MSVHINFNNNNNNNNNNNENLVWRKFKFTRKNEKCLYIKVELKFKEHEMLRNIVLSTP